MPPAPEKCPDCRVALEPNPLSPDPEARLCPRCGMDRLGLRMRAIAGRAAVWDYRDVRVCVRWRELPPGPRELAAIKKLLPDLSDLADAELGAVLGRDPVWEAGVFRCQEALELWSAARALGLRAELVYLPETRGTSLDPHAHGNDDDE